MMGQPSLTAFTIRSKRPRWKNFQSCNCSRNFSAQTARWLCLCPAVARRLLRFAKMFPPPNRSSKNSNQNLEKIAGRQLCRFNFKSWRGTFAAQNPSFPSPPELSTPAQEFRKAVRPESPEQTPRRFSTPVFHGRFCFPKIASIQTRQFRQEL